MDHRTIRLIRLIYILFDCRSNERSSHNVGRTELGFHGGDRHHRLEFPASGSLSQTLSSRFAARVSFPSFPVGRENHAVFQLHSRLFAQTASDSSTSHVASLGSHPRFVFVSTAGHFERWRHLRSELIFRGTTYRLPGESDNLR